MRALRPKSVPSSPAPGRSPWRALRHPAMRWWTGANLVSSAGTWMQMTVQNLLVLQITGSPAATGLSLAVQAAPGLLFGVAGGAVVDRWPRKVVVAVSQAVLGAIALVTALLVGLDALNLPLLLALSAVTGLVAAVDGPATSLLGNDLVPPDDVPSAIGLGSVTNSVGRLAGVGIAGGLLAFAGPAAAYLGNGISFLAVAALVPFLRLYTRRRDRVLEVAPVPPADLVAQAAPVPQVEPVAAAEPTAAAEPAEPGQPAAPRAGRSSSLDGIRYFCSRPRLVALLAVTAVSAVFGRNYSLTLAVLVTGALAGTTQDFATVASVLAVGGIVGAFLAGRLRRPSVRIVAALAAGGALLQVLAGLSPTFALLLVVVAPMAVLESFSDTAGATVLQTDPPAAMRGRVLGVWRSASTAWGLAGPPLLGLLMELIGVRAALVAGGLFVLATIVAGAVRNQVRTARLAPARPARSCHRPTTARPSLAHGPGAAARDPRTASAVVLTPPSSAWVGGVSVSADAVPWPRGAGTVRGRSIRGRSIRGRSAAGGTRELVGTSPR
ncbi:MFS transporter [Promicromonospora iranensis]|uniref:MFS transporter n=1 Tax=Promicromonospora iranensis TaxID=1105144 RepID=UPI0023A9411D|nr:MFS transporter [Promicromonospora iranensis]